MKAQPGTVSKILGDGGGQIDLPVSRANSTGSFARFHFVPLILIYVQHVQIRGIYQVYVFESK